MPSNEYKTLILSILVQLRGKMSQSQLSSKLGKKHNHVYKWESGQRKIHWHRFIELASFRGVKLESLFYDLYSYDGDINDIQQLTEHIFMNISSKTISKSLNISPFRVNSWRKNTGPFYFSDMIAILDVFSKHLVDFCLLFFTLDEIESMGITVQEYKCREFEAKNPLISLIFRILESDGAKNSKNSISYISNILNIEKQKIKELLDQSSQLGLIERDDKKYNINQIEVDIRGKKALKGRKFWLKKSLEFIDSGEIHPPDNIFGNLIYCINEKGQKKILDEYLLFFNRVRELARKNQGNLPFVMNVQFLKMNRKNIH